MATANITLPIDIEELTEILKANGVVSASVFGSYARGEARPDSDLDLLVSVKQGISLFDIVDMKSQLEKALKIKVDIATKLHPRFEPYITPDLIKIL